MKTAAQNEERRELPVERSPLLMWEPLFKTIFLPNVLSAVVIGR